MQPATSPPPLTTPLPLVRREWDHARFDVCALLRADEVAAVYGSQIDQTKSAGGVDKSLYVSQCFYLRQNMQPAVEISVIEKDPATEGRSPINLWEQMFTRGHESGFEHDREGEEDSERQRRFPPQKISDLGAEAYWMPVGILYVLRGDRILGIAVSGTDPVDAKLAKAKSLARAALGRL